MSLVSLSQFLDDYGMLFLFLVVFLEYLNIPGLPGGLILLLAGIWVDTLGPDFALAFGLSVVAGLAGSCLLYMLGKKSGWAALSKFKSAHPQSASKIDALTRGMVRHGSLVVFLSKLTPTVRTLVGLPAGMVGMDLKKYLVFSALGIAIWNGALMLAGMYWADLILPHLGW